MVGNIFAKFKIVKVNGANSGLSGERGFHQNEMFLKFIGQN